jgi:hypothetical protein
VRVQSTTAGATPRFFVIPPSSCTATQSENRVPRHKLRQHFIHPARLQAGRVGAMFDAADVRFTSRVRRRLDRSEGPRVAAAGAR